MTTIAYDGKRIAADRLRNNGESLAPLPMEKIWTMSICGDRLVVAGAGNPTAVMAIARTFAAHIDSARKHHALMPEPTLPKDSSASCLIVDVETGRVFHVDSAACSNEVTGTPYACGSGREYALGAMAAGASADDAVRIASAFCPYTGNGIRSIELEELHLPNIEWLEVL